ERRHASEIAALGRDLRAAAPDDVVDLGGVDAGALGERAEHGSPQLLRMNARQRALAGLADSARGSAGGDGQCVSHGCFLDFLLLATVQRIFRKKSRTSLMNSSGCSNAAKWPPFGISLQCVMLA